MLAFKPTFIRTLWNNITQLGQTGFTSPISLLSKGLSICKLKNITISQPYPCLVGYSVIDI